MHLLQAQAGVVADGSEPVDLGQEPGDILFFPSRVYHQVVGLEPSISLTHNWFNDTNAARVYWEIFKLRVRGMFGIQD